MNFNYDIYISYTIKDNQSHPNEEGWIVNFKRFLEMLILQILGEKPVFLNYTSQEKPASSELHKSGVFISILSPEYVKNEACIEELEDFYQHAQKNGNLLINKTERIFKVTKFPVAPNDQPSKLTNLLSYDLFYTNLQTGEISEFHDFFNIDAERKFWLKLVDLAYDISAILKASSNLALESVLTDAYSDRNVYLAETGSDLLLHRDNIKRELVRHGFRVLPDHSLPLNLIEMELSIKRDLERSRLSIHLIGDNYGEFPVGSDKSILDVQNKLAGEFSLMSDGNLDKRFTRLIWISPDAELQNDKQKIFIDNLRRELEVNEGAEILQSPIEDFKMVVLDELLDLNLEKIRNRSVPERKIGSKDVIYFIYDKIDEFEAKKIIEFLKYSNYDVVTPSFDGQLLQLREIHLENLKICDNALIFINKVNDIWVQMKFLDLLKAPGLGRIKGEFNKALILGKEQKPKLDEFQRFEVPIFEYNAELENLLIKFLKKFRR